MNKPLYELFESNATDEEILASIAAGADVNATRPLPATQEEFDKNLEDGIFPFVTPMQFAVKQRRSEKVIRALAEAGADVNTFVKYADFSDKLDDAGLVDGDEELYNAAVDQDWVGPHSPLCIVLLNEDCERIELLGELGADPYAVYMEDMPNDERSLEEIAMYGFDWDNSTMPHPEVTQSYLKAKATFRR